MFLAALLVFGRDESDGPALGLGRGHELADGIEDDLELAIVPGFQGIEAPREVLVGGEASRRLTKARTMYRLTSTARAVFKTEAAMSAPCSVKA